MYSMLGIYLQASCIISFFFCILLSILWWFSGSVLTLLHQDPQIAKAAGLYLRFLIPGLFAYGMLQSLLRFLQTQSVVTPLVIFSVLPLILHIGIAYCFTHWTSFPFTGAALAASFSFWLSVIMLALYVLRASRFKHTWKGFSMECFNHIGQTLKLAIPCAAMVWLVYILKQFLPVIMLKFEINAKQLRFFIVLLFQFGVLGFRASRVISWRNARSRDNYFLDCNMVRLILPVRSESSLILSHIHI